MLEQRLRRILEVGRTVVAELDLETVLARVLDEARELTGARYAALGILDEQDRRQLERFLTVGIDAETQRTIGDLPRGRGVLGVLIRDPRPLRLDDVSDHPRSYGFPVGHPPMRSFLGVPILIRGQAYGNLYLTDKRDADAFDADDEETIVLLAAWAGVAIENARAYRGEQARRGELEQAVAALEATTAIARAVGGETDLDRVLELIAKRARALVEARGVHILLRVGDELEISAVAGAVGAEQRGTRVSVGDSVSGEVLRTRHSQRLSDPGGELRGLARTVDASSALVVPLLFRGRALGTLVAFDPAAGGEFSAEDERLLDSFAASAATAVATAQTAAAESLRRSIESSERERQRWARELHDETLQELAGLKVLLSGARRRAGSDLVAATLGQALEQLDDSIGALRRLITDLRPAALDELGPQAALEGLIERVAQTSGLKISLRVDLAFEQGREPERHPAPVEDALYRIVQEALTNAVKHAGATRVDVRVVEDEAGRVELSVSDDGRGFDAAAPTAGFGLIGMRERVALVGGSLTVERSSRGGTTIRAVLLEPRPAA